MRELGIKTQYVNPYTVTTIDPDFNEELENIPDEEYHIYMDFCRICISDKHYRLIFKKNNCLGPQRYSVNG